MRRERLVAVALRAYPRRLRAALGPEMADTLLESSEGSPTRFAHEIVVLCGRGLAARARLRDGEGTPRLLADGTCVAGGLFAVVMLASMIGVAGHISDPRSQLRFGLLAATAVLAIMGRDRGTGVGLVAIGALEAASGAGVVPSHWIVVGFPIACGLAMLAAPRRARVRHELLAAAALIVPLGLLGPPTGIEAGFVAVSVLGLVWARRDIRPALGCTLVWLWIAVDLLVLGGGGAPTAGVLVGATLVLTLTAAELRRQRRLSG